MNRGRFFQLDLEASRLAEGLAVFSYTKVQDIRGDDNDPNRDTPFYPFYLQFSHEGVKFYVHYFVKETSQHCVDEETNQHRNSLILELPISSNIEIHDNLTQKLNDIFQINFPYETGSKKPLTEVFWDNKLDDDQNYNPSYSSLSIFKINYEQFKKDSQVAINGFLRKLFLDFLFDIEHTDVFRNSAHYDEVYTKLKENFLYNAIDNKSEYYYQRRLIKIINDDNPNNIHTISAGKFLDAEKRWIDSITDNRSEIAFEESDWFENPDIELKRVFSKKVVLHKNDSKKEETAFRRNDVLKIFQKKDQKLDNHSPSLYKVFKSNAKKSSDWFIKKYSFSGTPLIWGVNYNLQSMVLFGFLVLLGMIFFFPDFFPLKFICENWWFLVCLFIGTRVLKWLVFPKQLWGLGLSNVIMPRLLAAIMTAWFTLTVSEDVFKGFFDRGVTIWMNGLILFFTFFFVYSEVSKRAPFLFQIGKLMRVSCFIVIALFYSFIVGTIMMSFFGERYIERQDFLEDFYISYVFPEDRDFAVPKNQQISFLENVFCKEILFKYDISAQTSMNKVINNEKDLFIVPQDIIDFIEESIQDKTLLKNNYKSIMAIQDEKEYKRFAALTLLCVNEFIRDSASIQTIYEQVTNEHLIDSRLERVNEFLKSMLNNTDTVNVSEIEINVENLWVDFLAGADHPAVYRKGLEYLTPKADENDVLLSNVLGFTTFKNILIQFAFIAMFVGVFLQFMLSDRAVNDPI